ncbi:MAG: VWA domain-containing protein, partial [Mogibacterium sp.]|nr:VWA domain-containing protein [Mogibacterium sp.]
MNNLKKRCLTLLLSLAMIVTYMPTSMIAYAVDANGQAEIEQQVDAEAPATEAPAEETVTEEAAPEEAVSEEAAAPEEAPVEEAAPEEAATEEEAAPEETAPAEEAAAEEVATEEPASVEEETPAETEEPVVVETEEEDAEEAEEPEEKFAGGNLRASDSLKRYEAVVSYGEEAKIPDGAKLVLTPLKEGGKKFEEAKEALVADENGNSAFSQATEEEQKDLGMVAFDLTIYDKEGKKVEPQAEVNVSFKLNELPDGVDAEALAASMEIQHLNESSGDIVVEKIATVDGYEAKKDDALGEINVNENNETAEVKTVVDGFSTYTITWSNGTERTTVHYGYMENGTFHEFDADPAPMPGTFQNHHRYLIYDFNDYQYADHTYYRTTASNTPASGGTEIQARLRYYGNDWQRTSNGSNWSDCANNSHIYVLYEKKTAATTGGTAQAHITPETEHPTEPTILKESADNHDGTRTLALSITGHTTPLEAEKLADVIVVFDRSGSMRYNMAGTGNQYGTANTRADQINENARLSIAARAVNSMARTLLSKTNSSGGKLIRMALIDFSTSANVTQGFTDNINTFTSAVNALTGNGGTNWEQSLQLANQLPVDSERATFVIFVSDGDPTFRVSRMDVNDTNLDIYDKDSSDQYYVSDNVFGNGSTDPAGHDYDAALVEAKSIVQHNKRLYTIGISNDVSNMAKLNSEAGGSGNYTATTSAQLEEAFNQIISEIEGTLGYGANIEDGVTGLTNLTAKAPIVGVDENSFKYYRNGQEWDPVAAGAKAAKYNAETGAVEWDLGTNFQLENDVTYKVEFLVWPSQKAIDYVTQLNNGEIQYSEIPEADRNQIEERPAGSGKYVLKTNTDDAHVTYQESSKVGNVVTPIGETKTAYFKPVDPLQLDTMPLSLEKIWTDTLTEGEDRETEVTLFLQRRVVNGDGTFGPWVDFEAPYTKPDGSTAHSNKIVLSDGNDWKATFYISPGLETDHDGTTVVYNPGYEFRVTEPNQDYHYELNGEIIKPMLINLEKTYVGDADGNHALTAENIVKSGIDVKKTLFDKNGNKITPDVEFTIKGKILDPKGNPYTFNMAWDDRDDKSTAAGASAEWVEHQNDPIAFHKYDKDGTRIGYKLHVASTDNIEITLKPGEYVRFVNVPQNCTFEFEENDKDGFELEDIDASIKKMKDGTLVPDTDAAPINTENDKATLVAPGLIGDRQYSVGFNNKVTETTKATVTKKFTGITADQLTDAFKNGYSITANYNGEDHTLKLTDTGVEVSSDGLTFTWTIKDLIIGDKVTVTESGHDTTGAIPGYEFQADGSTVEDTIDSLAALDAGGSIPESNKAELVNDYLQMVTDKSVKKIWGNPDDLEKLGITKVVVTLYRIVGDATNKVEVESFDLTAKNGWEHTFTNLPLYIDGVPVAYQILETAVYGTIDGQEKDIKHLFDVDTVVDGDTTTITNTYDVTPVEVSFPVKKVMSVPEGATGPNWSYGITVEAQGGAPAATTMTGTVTKAAPVTTFGPFKYDVPGTYTYKVTETGTYPNVTNDSEATSGKTVTVTVTDNGDGTLTATADSTAESPVTFTNVYEPDSTSKALEAKKTLNGRTLKADEFSFELYEKGGTTPIQTKKNAADGSVAFDAITYTKAGTYEYTIKEVVPTGDDALGGVTYDTTEHTAVVTVVDNGNGTMTATVKYDGEDAVPEFVNTYEADGNVTFAGTKTIDGRDMTSDDIFEFEVSENGTTNKWTVNNSTVDGSIAYPTISYTLDDIGTHTYTVKETSTDGDGITVDTNTYTVTVKVSDNGDGTLKVEASDNAKELDFVNTYKATGSVTFEGTKSIDSRDFNENEVFNFSI